MAASLTWDTHVNKLSLKLRQKLGMLKRIRHKVGRHKLQIIGEAIFTSKIRYGIALYGTPKFDFSSQEQSLEGNVQKLQVIQNDYIRVICNLKRADHVVMKTVREKLRMMSVNQLNIYHVALEMFNIMVKSSAERLKKKFTLQENTSYSLRNRENGAVKIPAKPSKSYFSYIGPKLYNFLPEVIRKQKNQNIFKGLLKTWIWDNIPSV